MAAEREHEWDALWAEHDRLGVEFERLRAQTRYSADEHAALRGRLARHREKLAAWRETYGTGGPSRGTRYREAGATAAARSPLS